MVQQDLVKNIYTIATETGDDQSNLAKFLVKLDKIVKGEEESFTLIFDDPLDNSVISFKLYCYDYLILISIFNTKKTTRILLLMSMNGLRSKLLMRCFFDK